VIPTAIVTLRLALTFMVRVLMFLSHIHGLSTVDCGLFNIVDSIDKRVFESF
jgi:hypothetical protein